MVKSSLCDEPQYQLLANANETMLEIGGNRSRVVLMLDWIDAMPPAPPPSVPR